MPVARCVALLPFGVSARPAPEDRPLPSATSTFGAADCTKRLVNLFLLAQHRIDMLPVHSLSEHHFLHSCSRCKLKKCC